MAEIRQRIVFHGRVQGVGFRYTAKYLAQSLGLTGWVENEFDGTVVMEIQGREPMIHKLQEGLNRNSFIEIEWIDTEKYTGGTGELFLCTVMDAVRNRKRTLKDISWSV